VRRAVFLQRSTVTGLKGATLAVEERWYASLVRPSVLVYELDATGPRSRGRACHYVPISTERAQRYIRS
jgi:hypothetical protein